MPTGKNDKNKGDAVKLFLCTFLMLLAGVFLAGTAIGTGIYKYVDEKGVCHYTNVPADKRYKKVMNLTRREGHGVVVPSAGPRLYTSSRRILRRGSSGSWTNANANLYDHHIRHAARVHGVDPKLIKAVIKMESDFNRYAVSSKGAQGLMQLMPATAKYLRVYDSFDPWQNIYGGTKYLKKLMTSFNGDLRLTLAAYNAGPTRVMKYRSVPRIPETIKYVSKVMRQYQLYQSMAALPLSTSIRVREIVTVN